MINKLLMPFRALKYKNFRLFYPCLILYQIGIWIENIVIGWTLFNLTDSPFIMGTVISLSSLPILVILPYSGILIDLLKKHKLLMNIQFLLLLHSLILFILAYTNTINVLNIIFILLILNIVSSIDAPLRQSIYINLIDNDRNNLGNAISLNSAGLNIARMLGPIIAGIVMTRFDNKICFLSASLCFVFSSIVISFIKINEKHADSLKNIPVLKNLKEGLLYIKEDKKILFLLLYLTIFCFLGMTYPMLMPIYTKNVFNANADTLGYLMSSVGIGALIFSVIMALKATTRGLKYILCSAGFIFSICYILIGISGYIKLSLLLMFILGASMTTFIISNTSLIQHIINDDKRGRVMSIHAICYICPVALSGFFSGVIAENIGISNTFIFLGLLLFFASLYFFIKFIKLQFCNAEP